MGIARAAHMRAVGVALVLTTATLLGPACAGDEENAVPARGGGGSESARVAESMALEQSTSGEVAPLPALGASVIKTADVALEVRPGALDEALADAMGIADRFGGFVLTSSTEHEGRSSGTVVLRVPVEQFEAALAAVEALGDVAARTVSGQDVGEEFIDLEARRRNLEAQEAVLLGLMRRATTIPGTIRVQRELQTIRLEIERIEGRLRFLRDRTDLSTISVDFEDTGPAPVRAGTLERAWGRARDGFLTIVSAIVIGAGTVLPIAVLVGLGLLIFRLVSARLTTESRT
jgi:hypothetical protein